MKKRAPTSLRERAIEDYHDILVSGGGLSAELFERLRNAMRRKGMVYGERPIGVALRPHLLEAKQFRRLTQSAEGLAAMCEKIAAAALEQPDVMTELGMTETEARLARIDPGFSMAGISTRMDSFVRGERVNFVEYNADSVSSLSDQAGLNEVLLELPAMKAFAERYRLRQFSPADQLLQSLLATYREWGGTGAPGVAILDWDNLPTSSEFVLLRDQFVQHGVRTIICSPAQLEYHGGKLYHDDFAIDLVYKRVLIHEFLASYDDRHPLIRAYLNRHVCVVNPFRCKIMHKKAVLEVLQSRESWFTPAENETVRRCVPWTRRVKERRTERAGKQIELLEFIQNNRSQLVLKPNDDYGGHGVFLGPHLNDVAWEEAISTALTSDYVVQDAVELAPEQFPVFSENEWALQPMFVDTNPFLFQGKVCGAMVRLSATPIVNVSSGAGETGFFVLEE